MIQIEVMPNGQVGIRERSNPQAAGQWVKQERLVKPLQNAINEFIEKKEISIDSLAALSCRNVPQPELTAFLQERKLVRKIDLVYIAGNEGIDHGDKKGFQVGIVPIPDAGNRISRDKAWFVWNNGYGNSDGGYIKLRRDSSSSFDTMHRRVTQHTEGSYF